MALNRRLRTPLQEAMEKWCNRCYQFGHYPYECPDPEIKPLNA